MEKIYTKLKDVYVMPNPGDLSGLNLDSCVVARKETKLYITPLNSLVGKRVEGVSPYYEDPFFSSQANGVEKYFVLEHEKKERSYCDLCKDRLNGITGNCQDYKMKPSGCSFDPAVDIKSFKISLKGWKKFNPGEVSTYSPFKPPHRLSEISFDLEQIEKNQKMRRIKANLGEHARKKAERYCSKCTWEGVCQLDTRKVVQHCMVPKEKTIRKCLQGIKKAFGSIEEYLSLFAYSGSDIAYKFKERKKKRRCKVVYPLNRKQFLIRTLSRPFESMKVSRNLVERRAKPGAVPIKNHEKIAILAWFFRKHYGFDKPCHWQSRDLVIYGRNGHVVRPVSIGLNVEGIEVTYYPWGSSYNNYLRYKLCKSFKDILSFGSHWHYSQTY